MFTALGWGSADFIARFTGRTLGPRKALFGMFFASGAVLTGVMVVTGTPWTSAANGVGVAGHGITEWSYVVGMGLGITVGTLLLYWGLARGPVTVVAPIVASYPAFNLLLAVAGGTRPSAAQWAATAVVMAGVLLVATLAAPDEEATEEHPKAHVRASAGIALLSSLVFSLSLQAGQWALPAFGELPTVWISRLVGVALVTALLLLGRERPVPPLRMWPALTVQGLLDGGAYLTLMAGSGGARAEVAVVVSSTFAAVTVALARVVLREPITAGQWAGIAFVVGGVATLSGMG